MPPLAPVGIDQPVRSVPGGWRTDRRARRSAPNCSEPCRHAAPGNPMNPRCRRPACGDQPSPPPSVVKVLQRVLSEETGDEAPAQGGVMPGRQLGSSAGPWSMSKKGRGANPLPVAGLGESAAEPGDRASARVEEAAAELTVSRGFACQTHGTPSTRRTPSARRLPRWPRPRRSRRNGEAAACTAAGHRLVTGALAAGR